MKRYNCIRRVVAALFCNLHGQLNASTSCFTYFMRLSCRALEGHKSVCFINKIITLFGGVVKGCLNYNHMCIQSCIPTKDVASSSYFQLAHFSGATRCFPYCQKQFLVLQFKNPKIQAHGCFVIVSKGDQKSYFV